MCSYTAINQVSYVENNILATEEGPIGEEHDAWQSCKVRPHTGSARPSIVVEKPMTMSALDDSECEYSRGLDVFVLHDRMMMIALSA
jgi:hypothetical protein